MHSPSGPRSGLPALYHLHIPKTAGTTLYSLLEANFPPEKVCPVLVSSLDVIRMPREELARFDLLGGHWEFGYYLPEIIGRPVRVIAMLREPRAVLLSLYKQVMQEPLDPIRPYVDEHCPTLESFFFDPLMSAYVTDPQTRFLAVTERRFTPEIVGKLRAADPSRVDEIVLQANEDRAASVYEMLHRAKARLKECEVVGLVERFDESFERIRAKLGWPHSAPVPHKNVSRIEVKSEELPARVVSRLDELTLLDRILYDEAVARFEAEGARPTRRRRAA